MANLPGDEEARRLIIEYGRRMYDKNYVAANDGNISCRVHDPEGDAIWATPTGVSKGFMCGDELVKLSLDGTLLHSGARRPSSEIKMHLRIYNENPAVNAVCHAHPAAATSFAIAGISLDRAVYPEALVTLGVIPCAPYARPGSQAVPDSVAPYCRGYNGMLLGNHGALTWGVTLEEAFFRLESMEHYAQILINLKSIGAACELTEAEIDEVIQIRESLGVKTGGRPRRK